MPDKDKKRQSLFSKMTLGAAMAEAPAVMTASGWYVDKNGDVIQGDPMSPANRELAKNLAEIATIPISELGAELALPYIIRGVKSTIKGYKGAKNLVKSRKIMRQLDKLEQAGDYKAFYDNPGSNDIQSLSYFTNQDAIDKAGNLGRMGKIKYTEELKPEITKYPNKAAAQDAVNYAREVSAKSKNLTTQDIMRQIAEDTKSLKSGDKVSLITDEALSKDSYPLYQQVLLRNQQNGKGAITVIRDGDTYRMIRLNHFGHNPKSIERIDKSIEAVRQATGDINVPNRVSIGPVHYVPATEFKMFGYGGDLISKGNINILLDAIRSVKKRIR